MKIPLNTNIVDRIFTLFATIIERSSNIAQDFLERLILNPNIWSYSDTETQCEIINRTEDFINSNPKTFIPQKVTRLFMNTIEYYINSNIIQRLWIILSKYVGDNFSAKVMNEITVYTNINYIRRLNGYPMLLYLSLLCILRSYIEDKGKVIKIINNIIKTKKTCDLLLKVLMVLEYISYQINRYAILGHKNESSQDTFKKEDLILLKYYKENPKLIEKIMGICLYLAIDLDWSIFDDTLTSKEEIKANKISSSLSTSSSIKPTITINEIKMSKAKYDLLKAIFTNNQIPLGLVSYKAFMSAILGCPEELWNALETTVNLNLPAKEPIINKSALILIIQCSKCFSLSIIEEFVNKLISLLENSSEVCKDIKFIQSILGLTLDRDSTELQTLKANVIHNAICIGQAHLFCFLSGAHTHKLNVLNKVLDTTLQTYSSSVDKQVNIALKCVDLVYGLEDILECHSVKEEMFMEVLCKIMILLDKVDLLYVALPPWSFPEQRQVEIGKDQRKIVNQEREGGILRILLKTIFICIKEYKNDISLDLLRYVLFRENTVKAKIKIYVENKSSEEAKEEKIKHSLTDIIFSKDSEAIKKQEAINEFYIKKVIPKQYGVFDLKGIGKVNYFESPLTLVLHVLVSVVQLIYYDLLETDSYSKILKDNIESIAKSYKQHNKQLPSTCINLIQILYEILKYDKHNIIVQLITTEFGELLDTYKDKLLFGVGIPTLENVYSNLDSNRNEIKERELSKSEMESLKLQLTAFAGNWIRFISALLNISRVNYLAETYEDIIDTFLNTESLFELQPMVLYLTLHPFYKIDSWAQSSFVNDVNQELQNNIRSTFEKINMPKEKLKQDIISLHNNIIGKEAYKKLKHEQESDIGCWHKRKNYLSSLFGYMKRRYEKLECSNSYPFNEFVKLSEQKDNLGRSLIMKRHKKIEENVLIGYNYIKIFILKKMLVKSLLQQNKSLNHYYTDFKYKLVKKLFTTYSKPSIYNTKDIPDEYIPINMRLYDVNLITIQGKLKGKLNVYKNCLLFYNRKGIIKVWDIEEIKEVIVRNKEEQRKTIEVYSVNGYVMLFEFFEGKALQEFAESFRKRAGKVEWVMNPEEYIIEKQFSSQWLSGVLSNFEYLMLINKYSGRSFNDLNQYPIFPLIIQDNNVKDLPEMYKSLGVTITSLSSENSGTNISIKNTSETIVKNINLVAGTVTGYLAQLEPYTSLLNKYEGMWNIYKNEWLMQNISKAWQASTISLEDKLIPEFFYLPEIFCNHNLNAISMKKSKISLDKAIISIGTKDNHKFVKKNAVCLESKRVTLELDKWIDIYFGKKMSDAKSSKSLTEEVKGENQSKEVYGKLFNEKHPPKDEKELNMRRQYAIFNTMNKANSYVLLSMKSIDPSQAVIFIAAFNKKILTILNSQKLYQTKEIHLNTLNDRTPFFEKKELNLFPFKPFYNDITKVYNFYDSQRTLIARHNGTLLLTCRHYDCAWRMVDCTNGNVKEVVKFHGSIINCICDAKKAIFTGSDDGIVAMWHNNLSYPIWYAANHNLAIITIDACEKLNIVVTAGIDNHIVLRRATDGYLLRIIKPELTFDNTHYVISHIRLSFRGYIVLIGKCKRGLENDYMSTYSVNGEEIAKREVGMIGNVIVMSEDGYEFIVGGKSGMLMRYKLLTLKEHNMFEYLDTFHKTSSSVIIEFTNSNPSITAMSLTPLENFQQLIIGTSTGMFYVYKYSPRSIETK